jgi:hypothetical protein
MQNASDSEFGICAAYSFGVLMGVLASNGLHSIYLETPGCAVQDIPEHGNASTTNIQAVPSQLQEPRVLEVLAVQWKRQLQLHGSEKDASRELATEIMPDLAKQLQYARSTLLPSADSAVAALWAGACAATGRLAHAITA